MAGASNYPRLPDMDSDLLRRVGSDAIVPADHNNLVDAIQSIEQALGFMQDGTESGGSAEFNTGLADYVGMPSVAMANPRLPWASPSASDWRASSGALGAGWGLYNGATLSWTAPKGLCKISYNAGGQKLIATCNPVGSTPWCAVGRTRHMATGGTYDVLQFGYSAGGSYADLDGIAIHAASNGGTAPYRCVGGVHTVALPAIATPFVFWRIQHTGAVLSLWVSVDGICWGAPSESVAAVRTPTAFIITTDNANPVANPYFWLDFIAFGNSDPLTAA